MAGVHSKWVTAKIEEKLKNMPAGGGRAATLVAKFGPILTQNDQIFVDRPGFFSNSPPNSQQSSRQAHGAF